MRTLQFVRLTAIAVALLSQSNANAKGVLAAITEYSSGPDIYVCNMGVATASRPPVCYRHGDDIKKDQCLPVTCTSAKDSLCKDDCICTSVDGSEYVNSVLAQAQAYDELSGLSSNAPWTSPVIATSEQFSTYSDDISSWNNRLQNVTTKFTSELYTASTFIDICYRATQVPDYYGQVKILTNISATPFIAPNPQVVPPGDNANRGLLMDQGTYLDRSQETYQVFRVCADTISNTKFTVDAKGVPTGGPNFLTYSEQGLSSSKAISDFGTVVGPHFCKVRYVLREKNYITPLPFFRRNRLEGAKVCTWTDITDPKASKNANSPLN